MNTYRFLNLIITIGWACRWATAMLMYVLATTPASDYNWDWFVVRT